MEDYLDKVKELAKLAGQLQEEGEDLYSRELLSLAGVSAKIEKNYPLKQALLLAGISLAHQKTIQPNLNKARDYLAESKKIFSKLRYAYPKLEAQIDVLTLKIEASLYEQEENIDKAIEFYEKSFDALEIARPKGKRGNQTAYISPSFADLELTILSKEIEENIHKKILEILHPELIRPRPFPKKEDKHEQINCTVETQKQTLPCRVIESLKEHYLDELNNYLANQRWQEADQKTRQIVQTYDTIESSNSWPQNSNSWPQNRTELSCSDLKAIDQLWLEHSDGNFGLSVQWGILKSKLDEAGLDVRRWYHWGIEASNKYKEAYQDFEKQVGWRRDEGNQRLSHQELSFDRIVSYGSGYDYIKKGGLPKRIIISSIGLSGTTDEGEVIEIVSIHSEVFSYVHCKL